MAAEELNKAGFQSVNLEGDLKLGPMYEKVILISDVRYNRRPAVERKLKRYNY